MIGKLIVATLVTAGMLLTGAPSLWAQPPRSGQALGTSATPARISYISGDVSFWRPGAEEWTPARVNTPLAPGDALYTGANGQVEVQIGPRAFLRAAEGTQVGLDNQEPGFVQFRVTAGRASLDLRELSRAQTVELDTPNAAFTIERTGYYHAGVTEDSTTFQIQRGGSATMTPAGGVASRVGAGQQVVVTGDWGQVDVAGAPALSEWDRWNYQRSDLLVASPSTRYVGVGVYGTQELDRYGSWRTVPSYGSVWVPRTVATGWSPYSSGRWIWDPHYGWTWLDDEPWGWAPYHYGRWVHTSGFWGWAPGPVVTRPVYAPALVVFLGGGVRLSVGLPLAWAPLAWGEPIIPWWGRSDRVGRPSWDGWGGPRVVNNVVVNNTTIVNVQNITVYRNVSGGNAVVGVAADRFGRADARPSRFSQADVQQLTPVRGQLAVKPVAASLAPASGTAIRPPEKSHGRPVVATRAPRDVAPALRAEGLATTAVVAPSAAPRLVAPPKKDAPPVRSVVAPSAAPGATPAIGAATPERPDGKRDSKADNKTAEQPKAPTPPGVVTPTPTREASPTDAPGRDDKRDKAAVRPPAPTPPGVASPPPRREATPADAPARPDAKRDTKAAERQQPPAPPGVTTPPPKREATPVDAPARPDAKRDKSVERPQASTPPPVTATPPKREAVDTPARPEAKRDKAVERPQASTPPPVVATPPKREVVDTPARPETKRDKAIERPQASTPPPVVAPPRREAVPVDVPARPDLKRDKAIERPQASTPPPVVAPPKREAVPVDVPARPDLKRDKDIERPAARPVASEAEPRGKRPEHPAEPVAANPEPSQPRGPRP